MTIIARCTELGYHSLFFPFSLPYLRLELSRALIRSNGGGVCGEQEMMPHSRAGLLGALTT